MNRTDLQRLCRIRLKEARILLRNNCYNGAYYLSGFAIELALKSCIAKKVNRYDFPDKELANKAFVHKLESLIKVAGLENVLKEKMIENSDFSGYWNVVKEWDVISRYDRADSEKSNSLFNAIANKNNGVLKWIQQHW